MDPCTVTYPSWVVNLQLVQQHVAVVAQHRGHTAADDGRPRLNHGAAGSDGGQACSATHIMYVLVV